MFNSNQWSINKEEYKAFLHCENDKALMAVSCIRDGLDHKVKKPLSCSPEEMYRWRLDPDIVFDRFKARIDATAYSGEAFPVVSCDFGPGGHAKYFKGCRYQFAEETTWYYPSLKYGDLPEYLGEDSILSDELACMDRLGELVLDKYLLAVPDNTGTIDALASLRGSENLLEDMIEDPDYVRSCTRKIMDGYFDSSLKIYDVLRKSNFGGSTHGWMQLWVDGKIQHLQADYSVMISSKMFEEFILADLDEACNWLDYSVYHFDGQEQIRHLDMLLSIKNLNTIQWTHVAGQPDFTHFIPEYKRIQSAGKGLIIAPTSQHQAKVLLENLKPQGLYLIINAHNEAEAQEYLNLR